MSKGVNHYKRDGTLYTGGTHKMPNGEVHTGKTHGTTSVQLFHLDDLSKKAKEKAMNYGNKTSYTRPTPKKKPKKKKKPTRTMGYK